MAEIADPWIPDTEGFGFRFAKTGEFWEGNNGILQLFNENISFHTNFLLFSLILNKIVPIPNNLTLGY